VFKTLSSKSENQIAISLGQLKEKPISESIKQNLNQSQIQASSHDTLVDKKT